MKLPKIMGVSETENKWLLFVRKKIRNKLLFFDTGTSKKASTG